MKMKKNLLFVAIAITVPVIFIGLRRNSAPFFSVKEHQCVQAQDALLSDDYFSSINNVLANLCKERCAAHVIIDRLKQDFLALKKVVIAYLPSGTRVMIYAHEPVCCLNNSVIFTTQKALLPKNVFTEDAVTDIPNIEVAHDSMKNAPQLISSLLQNVSYDMSESYDLELMTKHCVRFTDKQQPQFTILSSVTQEKLTPLLQKCVEIKRAINEKNGFDRGARWVADTRFAHYIVAYKA
jgi:hypothetical protein